jgi:hypothetical protein
MEFPVVKFKIGPVLKEFLCKNRIRNHYQK